MKNENELAEQRRSLTRRILEIQVEVAASKKMFFAGSGETPMSVRTAWALELAELELARHDVETLQNRAHRERKAFRETSLQGVLVGVLKEHKLDRLVEEAVARCDKLQEVA